MKKIFFLFTFLIIYTISINAQKNDTKHLELKWQESYEAAKSLATLQNKPILIYFYQSDTCALCKLMEKHFFETDKFKKIAKENFILFKANFPGRLTDAVTPEQKIVNDMLKVKFRPKNQHKSFPAIVIINNKEKKLGSIRSYSYIQDNTNYFRFLESILN